MQKLQKLYKFGIVVFVMTHRFTLTYYLYHTIKAVKVNPKEQCKNCLLFPFHSKKHNKSYSIYYMYPKYTETETTTHPAKYKVSYSYTKEKNVGLLEHLNSFMIKSKL